MTFTRDRVETQGARLSCIVSPPLRPQLPATRKTSLSQKRTRCERNLKEKKTNNVYATLERAFYSANENVKFPSVSQRNRLCDGRTRRVRAVGVVSRKTKKSLGTVSGTAVDGTVLHYWFKYESSNDWSLRSEIDTDRSTKNSLPLRKSDVLSNFERFCNKKRNFWYQIFTKFES